MTTSALNTDIREVENKILHVAGLPTTAIINTKICEVENKSPDVTKLL